MKSKINDIKNEFYSDLNAITSIQDFDNLYLKYFSKTKGIVTLLFKDLKALDAEQKKLLGVDLNDLQDELKNSIEKEKLEFEEQQKINPKIDLTLPVDYKNTGYLHPITQVVREMNEFFNYYGFSVAEGPEIETDEFNFKKLNLPEDHPARDLQDTLYIKQPDILLRTHTSSVESRVLTNNKPPIRIVVPGKTFRNETTSKTNGAFFHQYQGVVVDKGITIQHLKSTLENFHKFLFGDDVELRFRYKYYPEVSPGMGTDMKCKFCNGKGCGVCKGRGWIEVLGSGMIHYNTLKMCGIDPEVYTGFAFGMGLDRIVMQKFGIDDLRSFFGQGMIYD